MIKVGIVGASGYTGGEALRILLRHPGVEIVQATSESNAGHLVHTVHPNLRKQSQLKFTSLNDLKPCDVLFLCLPHGSAMRRIAQLEKAMIDLKYSLIIEATEDPDFFGFYSPDREGFTGVGHSVEDCLYRAKGVMEDHIAVMKREGLPVPNPNPTVIIQNDPKLVKSAASNRPPKSIRALQSEHEPCWLSRSVLDRCWIRNTA